MDIRVSRKPLSVAPLTERVRLSGEPHAVPCNGSPMRVEMGRQVLELHPDTPLCGAPAGSGCSYRIVDPTRYFGCIGHFATLEPGKKFTIDHDDENQGPMFSDPRAAFRRHLRIEHQHNQLVFSDRISELGTFLMPVEDDESHVSLKASRERALSRLVRIYGGPLQQLDADVAMERLRCVNEQLRESTLRRRDSEGNPGALLEIPDSLTPIIVGDLHGRVDNLLSVLWENDFLNALDSGNACLVLLGDAVHPDMPGELENMESSILIMDIILSLILAYPGRVYMLLGNHDSFSPDVMKSGVPQGLKWEKAVRNARGEPYVAELAAFYALCPLIAIAKDFVSCHAGPIRKRVSTEHLVNVRQAPNLVHELIWNRVRSPGFPAGYGKGDVKRFRKSLDLPKKADFIVGHHVVSEGETIWRDVSGIKGHHIIYSAEPSKVGVFTRVGEFIVPQTYRCEPLLRWTLENDFAALAGRS